MSKTTFGYSQKKLEEKAAKRGITVEAYTFYLSRRADVRSTMKQLLKEAKHNRKAMKKDEEPTDEKVKAIFKM